MERDIRTIGEKKTNVVIIVDADSEDDYAEIREKFLQCVRRMARKKELGFYITTTKTVSFEWFEEFTHLRLQIPTLDRGTLYRIKGVPIVKTSFVRRTLLKVFKSIVKRLENNNGF